VPALATRHVGSSIRLRAPTCPRSRRWARLPRPPFPASSRARFCHLAKPFPETAFPRVLIPMPRDPVSLDYLQLPGSARNALFSIPTASTTPVAKTATTSRAGAPAVSAQSLWKRSLGPFRLALGVVCDNLPRVFRGFGESLRLLEPCESLCGRELKPGYALFILVELPTASIRHRHLA